MSKFTVAAKRFGGFLKRNAFYLLIILCIASVATVIALAVTHNNTTVNPDTGLNQGEPVIKPDDSGNKKPDDENPPVVEPPVEEKLTFIAPCNGTVLNEYSLLASKNPSLGGLFETHPAIDYVSTDLKVFASAAGTVKEVGNNKLHGNYIVLEHEDGYTTKYMSLEALPTLKVGDKVKQGQELGKMSSTQGAEAHKGDHLHFEIYKDNALINPLEVMVLDEK